MESKQSAEWPRVSKDGGVLFLSSVWWCGENADLQAVLKLRQKCI